MHPTESPVIAAAHASDSSWLKSLWARIKEHKIAQWTLAYAAFAFAALHAATLVSDALEWPHVIVRALTLVLIIVLPIVPVLAWYHGIRAFKRVTGSELIIIALLLAIGGGLLWLVPRPHAERTSTETASVPATLGENSIAVLPFTDMSEKKDQEYFADGMAEEVLDLLAKIPGLTVIGRTSSFQFKDKTDDLRTIGAKLGAVHIVEGSVRKVGPRIRVTAQLIDARSGAHQWSESYDRDFGCVFR